MTIKFSLYTFQKEYIHESWISIKSSTTENTNENLAFRLSVDDTIIIILRRKNSYLGQDLNLVLFKDNNHNLVKLITRVISAFQTAHYRTVLHVVSKTIPNIDGFLG